MEVERFKKVKIKQRQCEEKKNVTKDVVHARGKFFGDELKVVGCAHLVEFFCSSLAHV